ncbi:MAG: adenylosuccinate lyase [Anaerorhabdus sp.]
MLNRYSREIMRNIWSEENKFNAWLKVEILSCEAWSTLNVIPKEDVDKLWANAKFDIDRIYEIEKETRHDVVAFTRCVSESLNEEKKWVHYGLTSTDVVDTAYGYLYKQANKILKEDLDTILDTLKRKAHKYKDTVCIGRTHGVHAEVTTFGLKITLWYEEMKRNIQRFSDAASFVECGKISGAVGTFANTSAEVQDYVCRKLQISSAAISSQTLQRDRHAQYFSVLALIGSSLEKMAIEIRHLQRTEVREVEEYFNKNQKGSSAMPHKRNPIGSENICGCARILRGYMLSSFENIPLWHERDISHSSSERIMSEDATCLLDYMLYRFNNILDNLVVFEDNMLANIDKTYGVIFSQRFMLKLVEKNLSREEAYDLVQPLAIFSWENKTSFKDLILANETIKELLSQSEIDDCFNLTHHLKNVDTIFKRVF